MYIQRRAGTKANQQSLLKYSLVQLGHDKCLLLHTILWHQNETNLARTSSWLAKREPLPGDSLSASVYVRTRVRLWAGIALKYTHQVWRIDVECEVTGLNLAIRYREGIAQACSSNLARPYVALC